MKHPVKHTHTDAKTFFKEEASYTLIVTVTKTPRQRGELLHKF